MFPTALVSRSFGPGHRHPARHKTMHKDLVFISLVLVCPLLTIIMFVVMNCPPRLALAALLPLRRLLPLLPLIRPFRPAAPLLPQRVPLHVRLPPLLIPHPPLSPLSSPKCFVVAEQVDPGH